jgi:hypothetical protein
MPLYASVPLPGPFRWSFRPGRGLIGLITLAFWLAACVFWLAVAAVWIIGGVAVVTCQWGWAKAHHRA